MSDPGSTNGPAAERLVGADRVVAVLTELAEHPLGITLDELAGLLRSSKPTVHRALATLRRAGLADMTGRGVYVLGDEYLRLAFRNLDGRPETARLQPLLEELATRYGETAHYAVLAGHDIVYRAKMDPPQGAVKLTSVIGGRNPAYRTAVGKALLGTRLTDLAEVSAWLGPVPLEQKTPNTLATAEALLSAIAQARRLGYAVDDQENEIGINC
ncbi:MAG: IclR family transcriptional regulator, partial [Microbacterium sp.]